MGISKLVVVGFLSAAMLVGRPMLAASETFYIDDGRTLQKAYTDPSEVRAEEWQVRLYRRGVLPGGNNHWGLITGKSPDAVMKELKRSQDFQKAYAKFAGINYENETLTYFNYLGPIAKIKRQKPISSEVLEKIDATKKRIDQLHAVYRKWNEIVSDTPKSNPDNPYKNVGKVLREYVDNLKQAKQKLMELNQRLDALAPTQSDILASLSTIDADLRRAERQTAPINSAIAAPSTKGGVYSSVLKYDLASGVDTKTIRQSFSLARGQLIVNRTEDNVYSASVGLPDVTEVYHYTANVGDLDDEIIVHRSYTGIEDVWNVQIGTKDGRDRITSSSNWRGRNEVTKVRNVLLAFKDEATARKAAEELKGLISRVAR